MKLSLILEILKPLISGFITGLIAGAIWSFVDFVILKIKERRKGRAEPDNEKEEMDEK